MQMEAYRVMQRIRNPQTQWNTQLVVDNSQQGTPPGGQPPNAVPGGAAPAGGLAAALQDFTSKPPTQEMNPEQEFGAQPNTPSPATGKSNPMLDALLASRKSSKNNFLGGNNGKV
jgi:hypothetical protein